MIHSHLPLHVSLPYATRPENVFRKLLRQPHLIWFDSAGGPPTLSRYSIMTADPLEWYEAEAGHHDPWELLRGRLEFMQSQLAPDLFAEAHPQLPFQGGLAGLFSYDLCHTLERLPTHRFHDLPVPPLAFGWYDWALVWDHQLEQLHFVAQGWPEIEPADRLKKAQARYEQVVGWLDGQEGVHEPRLESICETNLAPSYETRAHNVLSNFRPGAYRDAINEVVQAIRAGDVFQVNLAQRLLIRDTLSPADRYLKLRQTNRAPFAGYFDGGPWQVLSSSPERLLAISEAGWVETRPIKGTCPRTGDGAQDEWLADQLQRSHKDRAENTMIVDLMRNDLSRFCLDGTVEVTQLCGLELYARVQHLVSVIRGRIRAQAKWLEAIKAVFPGGSVTGAPKPQAMRMIAELEPTRRGPYCGSLGYLSAHGRTDLNILIRTLTVTSGWVQIPVGGASRRRAIRSLKSRSRGIRRPRC